MSYEGTNPILKSGGFHHIAIRAFDYDATVNFYKDVLGFAHRHGWGTDARADGGKDSRACMLDCGDGNYLEVFAGRTTGRTETDPEDAILHVAFRSTDIPGCIERVRAAGMKITIEPKRVVPDNSETPYEFHIAFFIGPSGEIVELFDVPEL